MTIGITGGSGFVGTRLCARMQAVGTDFRLFDIAESPDYPHHRKDVDIRKAGDLCNAVRGCSAIVHLAAVHRDDVRPIALYDQTNVKGTSNVVEAAERNGVEKIVFTSSVACYGFAKPGSGEDTPFNPFNDYGRTKAAAEEVLKNWQARDPDRRVLVIVRPTVIFGERNRGNVYNLLRQIANHRFLMVGSGENRKSLAYVENVAAFLEYSLAFDPGVHVFNYVDTPDFSMNELVVNVRESLGRKPEVGFRIPFPVGLFGGYLLDMIARATGRTFPVSAIRIRKFCADSQYTTAVRKTGFVPVVQLAEGLRRTIQFEFVENHSDQKTFLTE